MKISLIYKALLAALLLLCNIQYLQSQSILSGYVSDLGSRAAIKGATIRVNGGAQMETTNVHGDFALEIDPMGPAGSKFEFSFFYNTIIWNNASDRVSYELYAVDGRKVHSSGHLGLSGVHVFPRLNVGIYFLQIFEGKERKVYKLFSNGLHTSLADSTAEWHKAPASEIYDTLSISAAGYYPRTFLVPRKDTFINIAMLSSNVQDLHYFNEIINPLSFELLATLPSRTNYGEVESVKIIFNTENDLMYYINGNGYDLHFDFADAILDFKGGHAVFNQTQYQDNSQRYLFPANLNWHKAIDKYVVQLVAASDMSCENLKILFEKIKNTSFFGDKLVFFANNPKWLACAGIPLIDSETLFNGQNYQALNLEENYGYLKKVELEDLEATYLSRREIVLLNGIPNDVSVVAGIITTEFQTPLSHINVLSHNRGTPNMALKDGWENPLLNGLENELVYLNVKNDSFEIRAADLAEAEAFWSANEPTDTIVLDKDLSLSGLQDLHQVDAKFVDRLGGKAANFGEMLQVPGLQVPEGSFGIPFYYYDQHLEENNLKILLESMLADPMFKEDPAYRKNALELFKEQIIAAPLNVDLYNAIYEEIKGFAEYPAFRFRSSTNAEDLPNFSGAGLYDSYSAKKDHNTKTIDRAVKRVWASLWNWRAYEEREYFKIDHLSCAMGILSHRSFPDEDANGVAVTKNLYNSNPGYIINVQYKEHSIVFPEPGVLHDQLILFTWSINPDEAYMSEYLTFSNIPELNGETVMTEEELFLLGDYCTALNNHFYLNTDHGCNCTPTEFALDIEFKIDSQVSPRKLYIKQARVYR